MRNHYTCREIARILFPNTLSHDTGVVTLFTRILQLDSVYITAVCWSGSPVTKTDGHNCDRLTAASTPYDREGLIVSKIALSNY